MVLGQINGGLDTEEVEDEEDALVEEEVLVELLEVELELEVVDAPPINE